MIRFTLESLAWAAVFFGLLTLVKSDWMRRPEPEITVLVGIAAGVGVTYLRNHWKPRG